MRFGFGRLSGALAALLVCSAGAAPARSLERVVLGLPTPASVSFSNFYMADAAGYLAAEGIALDLLSVDGTGPTMQLLLSGKVPVALSNPSWLILARQPGKEAAPVHFFYNYNRTNVWTIAVPEGSAVKSLADLGGKVLGVPNVNTGTLPMAKAILAQSGLASDAVQFLPVGAGVPAWVALKNGDIAALMAIKTWRERMETKGFASRLLPLPASFTTIPSLGFIARDDTIEQHPKLLIGLTRAVAKATIFCAANPEPCVKAFWQHHPEQAPAAGTDRAAALAHDVRVLRSDVADQLRFAAGEPDLLGHYPKAAWTTYIDMLAAGGEIGTRDVPLASLYTERFLHDINDFDIAAVRDEARAWHD